MPDNSLPPRATSANDRQVGGAHYKTGGLQHWDLAILFQWDPFQYQVTKYVMRWRNKNKLQDLEKALHFLEKYIEEVKAGNISSDPIPERIIPMMEALQSLDPAIRRGAKAATFLQRYGTPPEQLRELLTAPVEAGPGYLRDEVRAFAAVLEEAFRTPDEWALPQSAAGHTLTAQMANILGGAREALELWSEHQSKYPQMVLGDNTAVRLRQALVRSAFWTVNALRDFNLLPPKTVVERALEHHLLTEAEQAVGEV
jgi:hypothetical protein